MGGKCSGTNAFSTMVQWHGWHPSGADGGSNPLRQQFGSYIARHDTLRCIIIYATQDGRGHIHSA